MNQPNESTAATDTDADTRVGVAAARRSARARRTRRLLLSAILPAVLAALAFAVTYAVRSGAETRYGYEVTLATRHDGRTGAFDHRNELAEVLEAEVERTADEDPRIEVAIATRFNNLLDIEVSADEEAAARSRADELVALAIADRQDAATAIVRGDLDALAASLATANDDIAAAEAAVDAVAEGDSTGEAQRNLNSKIDLRNSIDRQLVQAQTELDSAIVPVQVVDERALGEVGPEPLRDAALGGAVAALLALAGLSAWRPE